MLSPGNVQQMISHNSGYDLNNANSDTVPREVDIAALWLLSAQEVFNETGVMVCKACKLPPRVRRIIRQR